MNRIDNGARVGLIAAFLCIFAGCAQSSESTQRAAASENLIECAVESPQICTREYIPVCGLRETGVRCVTTPCESTEWKTYGNACTACSDIKVYGYRLNSCKKQN